MDLNEKAIALQRDVEAALPDFVAMVRAGGAEAIVVHQDSFAADYQDEEFVLLGKAIKYAGIFGREIHIIGQNRGTPTKGPPAPP